jgi:hypothetical protein
MFYDVSVDTGIGMKREIELIKYGVASGVPPVAAALAVDPVPVTKMEIEEVIHLEEIPGAEASKP